MWSLALILFSLGIIICGILVISSKNPINAIINLILTFINGVGIFVLLGVDFIGLLYLIIYIGAIAILFLFVVMMLNVRKIEWNLPSWFKTYPLGFIIGTLYLLELYGFIDLWSNVINVKFNDNGNIPMLINNNNTGYTLTLLGKLLYNTGNYEYLIVISLILLVAMIGSIILTLKVSNENI